MSEGSGDSLTAWPSTTLPLPALEYDGEPVPLTLCSTSGTPKIARRNRFTASIVSVRVKWVFTQAQYDEFKSFFIVDLDCGVSLFRIELKYPYNAALTTWKVRFIGDGFTSSYDQGNWIVDASLDLLQSLPDTTPEPELPIGYSPFYVTPVESSDGEDIPFVLPDGYPYYVKDT